MKIGRPPSKKTSGKKTARRVSLVGLVLVITIIGLGRLINAPANGTITEFEGPASQSGKSVLGVHESPKQYDGKYISFSYPSGFQPVDVPLTGSYLEVARMVGVGSSSSLISLGLVREKLDNDSGFHYRQNHPEIYERQSTASGSAAFIAHQNGFERTIFITHNDLVLSVSASDPHGKDLAAVQNTAINSLKWK